MAVPRKAATAQTTGSTSSPRSVTPIAAQQPSKVVPADVAIAGADQTITEKSPTQTAAERDSYAVTAFADISDRSLHALASRFTMGLSPAALAHAYLDWATHLA